MEKKCKENKHGWIQYSVLTECSSQCCSVFLSLISFLSLFLLPNIFNPHTPTLECMNLPRLELQQKSPKKVAYDTKQINEQNILSLILFIDSS